MLEKSLPISLLILSCLIGTTDPLLPATARELHPRLATIDGKQENTAKPHGNSGSGTLVAMLSSGKELGQCPLTHTSITARISGYVAKVKVTQIFHNTYKEPIEAIYTFPLSAIGAVDEMVMKVGKRTIKGTIKKREEAKKIYDQARANGHIASLLDQERTNIFTQSVANIPPGATIEVTLQYVETLPYEGGKYSFVVPTVVGPRFIPGNPTGAVGTGRAADTDQVPDASKITPPVAAAETRAGHDLSIDVDLSAGLPIDSISSKLHEIKIQKQTGDSAKISLVDKNTIPNKDFVLTWNVAEDALKSGYLAHKDAADKSGYFTLMVMPPKRVPTTQVAPKEMIFLIDCSGSQSGLPLQKAKETLSYIVEHMNPQDTFQIIAFNNISTSLFDKPQAVSTEMKGKAQTFIAALTANGGTWMAPAVEAACATPADSHRLRIVTFMTDGYVGNDLEILGMIKKLRDTSRWFSFGTGNSVNHMLIDGIAQEGGGEADYVLLNSSAETVGKKFYDHISTPVLTDVKVDFGKLSVKEVFPKEVGDVWAERPLYFKGRYDHAGSGTVTLSGFAGGKPYKQTLSVSLPEECSDNQALASIWARAKVDRLLREDYEGAQSGQMKKELKEEITETALKHHIMSQFTSFVAVDETVQTDKSGKTIIVPVELPEGVSREMTIGGNSLAKPMYRAKGLHSSFASYGQSKQAMMTTLSSPAPQGVSAMAGAPKESYRTSFAGGQNGPAAGQIGGSAGGTSGNNGSVSNGTDAFTSVKANLAQGATVTANSPSADDRKSNEKKPDKKLRSKLSDDLNNFLTAGKNDNAEIKISLDMTGIDVITLAKLSQAGLKVDSIDATTKKITGKIKVKNLSAVAELTAVLKINLAKTSADAK